MSQVGATRIEDLDDTEQLINEIDNIINDNDNDPEQEEIVIKKPKKNMISPLTYKKLKKNTMDTILLMVLIILLSNKHVMNFVFKIPYLMRFENSAWLPGIILSLMVSIWYFIIKYFI